MYFVKLDSYTFLTSSVPYSAIEWLGEGTGPPGSGVSEWLVSSSRPVHQGKRVRVWS
jgi:hypothetical protein